MSTTAFQIKLEFSGSKPKIWRRLIIPADMLLSDLHKVIQTAMGWTNSHLHMFEYCPTKQCRAKLNVFRTSFPHEVLIFCTR